MTKRSDRHNEGENPLVLFDAQTINASQNDTTNPFWLRLDTNFSVEWSVSDSTDSDANFDLVLQFKSYGGTWFDDTADGSNNGSADNASSVLSGETSVRGVAEINPPYWARELRFRVNNDDDDNADFTLLVHRDGYSRRKV